MTAPDLEVLDGGLEQRPTDPRVDAVLEVLAGAPLGEVALRRGVDRAVLHRWVHGFVEAGTGAVTNRPDPDAARQRDRFLAAFAHELRTPLTVARGWVSLLADEELPPPVPRTVERLQESLARLTERVLDVELLAAASLGLLRAEPRAVPVRRLLAGVGGQAAEEDVADVDALVDPTLFPRVLRDLWEAGGSLPAPRQLRWEVTTLDGWVELRVVRDADPIDPAVLQALFEPFDLNDDATGVTIGLYLARALTVVHAGTLGVEQDDEHAVLWVRVPRADRRAPTDPPTDPPTEENP
ncbi:sensor histidine kinase [Nocardioides solisilvae]|uniref:sensor histidine kinase n=1 Tax=Nocardioides solisilvae TaxID=1542435 RepID=UPI0013A59B0A|nr:HAMP domain-containing sensor histidine kinase [Nocardioides solisilvae]